jgi:regulator of nucleoside diphosphate kinase
MFIPNGNGFELPQIYVLEDEYEALADLVCASERPTPGIELLWQELQRATVIPRDDARPDLVHLRSLVHFTELESGAPRAARVVRPDEAHGGRRVSVITPVGASLIGLKPGDSFPWLTPDGQVQILRIDQVAADPLDEMRRNAARSIARRRELNVLLSID